MSVESVFKQQVLSRFTGTTKSNNNNNNNNTNSVLPVYASLPHDDDAHAPRVSNDASSSSSLTEVPSSPSSPTLTSSRFNPTTGSSSSSPPRQSPSPLPTLQTFLADFTLGFADGLTVPFALTAGLSSLGQTSTVIYAGMAEICAGSISMGIGGYLAARGEARAAERESQSQDRNQSLSRGSAAAAKVDDEDGDDQDAASLLSRSERGDGGDLEKRGGGRGEDDGLDADAAALARYLAPLRLRPDLEESVLTHLRRHGYDHQAIVESFEKPQEEEKASSPILTGLSVSLGYLVGGIIPLFPYFFVSEVERGLLWSFLVCLIALFTFGFGKEFALDDGGNGVLNKGRMPWRKLRSSAWEGLQMVILGGVAALAAVLCVRLFDGVV